MVPYLLKHRSHLRRALKEKEEENRKVAESVLMGRERIAELQQLIQARQQAWQVEKPNQTPCSTCWRGAGMTFKPSASPKPPQQPSPAECLDMDIFSGGLRCFSLCNGGGMWDLGWSQGG